jgi:hypothetical protein
VGNNKNKYLYIYWKAPSILVSSNVACSPNNPRASGAWTAIMHPLYISSKPSLQSTAQPAQILLMLPSELLEKSIAHQLLKIFQLFIFLLLTLFQVFLCFCRSCTYNELLLLKYLTSSSINHHFILNKI